MDFKRIHLEIENVEVAIDVVGAGHPVLYLHGGATIEGFAFARHLAEKFQVFCPHHPGMGMTADAPEIYSIDRLAHHYLALIEHLGLEERPHVIGFSMGGWIASHLAALNNEAIKRLVLVAPDGLNDANFPPANLEDVPLAELPGFFSHDASVAQQFFPGIGDTSFLESFMSDRQREDLMVNELYKTLNASAEFRSVLSRIQNKTFIVWGQEDRILPAAQMQEWVKHIKNSTCQKIENAGHFVMQEQPSSLERISEFLLVEE
ncbi:alpha/beta fold hydrolase [Pseudomonas taiwanensis]|uniref:Alpha/beta hydrolase n=1 Tax=Pseudomonas taiwanensis TaxID=470150 RepID=A0ABR6V5A5_9PSED|nr:alpha/beta hydrolase [Pseudomonas taiwanensis]MBC3475676.1 alpha/beta hydrolase [Pseudomonas taiwanensis]MBC3489444.1 alpha/beta hydrolase [Pseudomonas taiwanensis]